MKLTDLNRRYRQLIQNYQVAHHTYSALGQAIAALIIQLQVAHKLWQINPIQAQRSLDEAYALSLSLMQDIRQTIKNSPRTFYDDFQDSLTARR